MSWPCARKVLAAVWRTAVLGVVAGAGVAGDGPAGDELAGDELAGDELAGDELAGAGELACVAGALDVTAAEGLAWELQAVTSRAAQAMPAQPATCRGPASIRDQHDFQPLNSQLSNRLAKTWHLHDGGATATTGGALCRGW